MIFLQDVLHKQEFCKNLVRNYYVGKSLQDWEKNAYLARNLQKECNLERSCTKNAFACKIVFQDLVRTKFWVV